MELRIKFVGEDDWYRKVYIDEDGNYYKTDRYDPTLGLYTCSDFYGEPSYLVSDDTVITVVE